MCDLPMMCDAFLKKGQNCNVMVYGPTNSGKTFTMLGNKYQSDSGLKKYNSPKKAFKKLQRPGSSFGLRKKCDINE